MHLRLRCCRSLDLSPASVLQRNLPLGVAVSDKGLLFCGKRNYKWLRPLASLSNFPPRLVRLSSPSIFFTSSNHRFSFSSLLPAYSCLLVVSAVLHLPRNTQSPSLL